MDNEILDYKDLAAIPKVKAIYDIERPDLITYEPFYTSGYDDKQERQSLGEVTHLEAVFIQLLFHHMCKNDWLESQ